jgi:hypothetical protein
MVLFSRAFIRKRVISLATTASVAATSFALAQDPSKIHHVRAGLQYPADRQREITVVQNTVSERKSSVAQSPEQPHATLSQLGTIGGSAAHGGMRMFQ